MKNIMTDTRLTPADLHPARGVLRPLAALMMSGLLFAPASASAQDAPATTSAQAASDSSPDQAAPTPASDQAAPPAKTEKPGEEVVPVVTVTGIRSSIESSIATKRDADSIIEAVTAEDIGKLPDVSIAESLARLPGVTAQRVNGRAEVLSIRGMAPSFGVTLLNGREMASTGDDRSFEYDQFPSELVTSGEVYKTPDAALGTQGLSGTIDLHTVRPLDYSERKVSINARADQNSFGEIVPGSKSAGDRLSFSYIDQFADHTVGVALGFAHLDSPEQKKYFNPWDYGANGVFDTVNGVPDGQYTFNGFETGVASTQTKRDGLLAVLEYKPNQNFHSQLDVFHSQFDQRMRGTELTGVLGNWGDAYQATVTPFADGSMGGTVDNSYPLITQRADNRKDKVDALGWNNELKLDKWTLMSDLSYSRAKRKETTGEAYALSIDPQSYSVHIPTGFDGFGSISSTLNFADPTNFQLATAWWGGGAYVNQADVNDETKSLRLSAKRNLDWGAVSDFDGGLIYSERKKEMNYVGTSYDLNGGTSCTNYAAFNCLAIPSGILQSPVNLGFSGVPSVLSFDVLNALNSGAYVANTSDAKNPVWNWGVKEKITTAFAKLNLDFQSRIPVHGNVGVQIVSADQHATGLYQDADGNQTPIADGTRYTDVLPSLNLTAEIAKGTQLRLGVAKTVARPDMADMRAGTTASVDQTGTVDPVTGNTVHLWSGSGGNPKLKPWRANAYDLSLEKYFGKRSYVAMAGFYKKVTTGIIYQDTQYDFSGFANPSPIPATSNMGTLTTPVNTNGGKIYGYELSGSLEGGLINQALDGFGLIGSFSNTHSNLPGTDANGAATNTSLEGLSGDVWSLTAYYEKNGFQARIAQRYRSEFTAKRHNAFVEAMDTIRAELITDAQVGYEFESGPYKGLSILFQVNNLFNTPYVATQTVGGVTALKEYHEFGTQYLLGVNYSF